MRPAPCDDSLHQAAVLRAAEGRHAVGTGVLRRFLAPGGRWGQATSAPRTSVAVNVASTTAP
jgi:hypothetical protein